MSKITDYFPPLPLLEAFPVPGCVAAGVPTVQKESMVKRQKSLSSRDLIVEKYKSDLKNVWIDHPTTISTWFGPITMHCKVIDDTNLPVGFTKTAEGKYQYNFTDPELTDKKRYRPIAYRMSFLLDPNFYNSDYTRPLKPINQGMAVQVVPIATI
ncbi:uncharacterized protein MONOS_17330 [Monocercomonoides exilis]|uniref:uncharacterized protein n=1 Tax=Monocercomonoides exilis TaxID=2049356 RepID=UPI00355AB329|nr:hypothetical protein MONOS_18501 [Monocercomonoides exilis]KAH7814667.1 hypothetical protein MONOS_18498 [Monocercomonoides exilis]KAH7827570.1 hypothetical protein MONOS_17330 [Monocercomonoides exilis]